MTLIYTFLASHVDVHESTVTTFGRCTGSILFIQLARNIL
jgi:hypothetical protein